MYTQNAQELSDYASRFGPGYWIFAASSLERKSGRQWKFVLNDRDFDCGQGILEITTKKRERPPSTEIRAAGNSVLSHDDTEHGGGSSQHRQ